MRAVNLLPKDAGKQRSFITPQNAPVLVGAGLGIVVVGALALSFNSAHAKVVAAQQALDAAKQQQAALPPLPPAPAPTNATLVSEQSARVSALSAALAGRIAYDRILRELSQVLPDDVWLTQMQVGGAAATAPGVPAGSSLTLAGTTYSYPSVARLLTRLQLVPELSAVHLAATSSDPGTHTVSFQIQASLPGATPPPAPPTAAPAATTDTTSTGSTTTPTDTTSTSPTS